ncbi:MAG: DUF1830 domain-containing protein [Cyanobacteria bacterium J007]|nr:MAG: DUF1830 domain-containing protein [Cyanobacteria bacterium J007]
MNVCAVASLVEVNTMLCCYLNETLTLQIVRVMQGDRRVLERVIFPRQRFLFEGVTDACLEVYRGSGRGLQWSESIPCSELKVEEVAAELKVPPLKAVGQGDRPAPTRVTSKESSRKVAL